MHKHIKFPSFELYSADHFQETLNDQHFNDATRAYDDFIQKITVAIKERSVKYNSQEWFNGEISEAIKDRDKLLKKN